MADLKNENPRAVEFFGNRGREYFQLREDLKEYQMSGQELGDLSIEQIRIVAQLVRDKMEKGGVAEVDKTIALYENQSKILKSTLEDTKHTPPQDINDIQQTFVSATTMLNLFNLFKNILVRIQNNKENVDKISGLFPPMANDILEALRSQNGDRIISSMDSFIARVDEFTKAYGEYESAAAAYHEATLEQYPELVVNPLSKEVAENLYLEITKAIIDARKAQAENPEKAPSIERTVVSLEEGLASLEKILPNELVAELRNKAAALSNGAPSIPPVTPGTTPKSEPQPAEDKLIAEFRSRMEAAYEKIFAALQEKYLSSDWTSTKFTDANREKRELVFNEFKKIPIKDKVAIDMEFAKKYDYKTKALYGKELFDAIKEVEGIIADIRAVNNLKPEDKSLNTAVSAVMSRIELLKNSKFVRYHVIEVNQVDNSLEVKFADERVHDRKLDILNKELYDKLYPSVTPETTPESTPETTPESTPRTTSETTPETTPESTPETTSETTPETVPESTPETTPESTPETTPSSEKEEKDIQFYLDLLRETNAKVAEINRINQELVFNNIFNELSMANILHDINVESTAVYQSAIVTKLRLELSDKRYDYLKKYGKYILANPELKDAKIEEIKFDTEFEEFLAKRDELIVDTELRIKELDEKKPEGYETEKQHLLEFIKAQNSLVKRFLIAESVSRNIDIAQILSERNERRKAIRQAKENGYSPETTPESIPETTPESTPRTTSETTPESTPETTPESTPETTPESTPETTPESTPETTPESTPETTPESTPETTPESTPETKPEEFVPVPKGRKIQQLLVKETSLQFNPRNNRGIAKKISANDRMFKGMPKITTTLIKNGVRIKLSKQLRERLAELSAKISLVNKDNRRIRTSRMVDGEATSQDVTFKSDHDVNFDDYTVEVRIPGETRSRVIFGDEEVRGRSR